MSPLFLRSLILGPACLCHGDPWSRDPGGHDFAFSIHTIIAKGTESIFLSLERQTGNLALHRPSYFSHSLSLSLSHTHTHTLHGLPIFVLALSLLRGVHNHSGSHSCTRCCSVILLSGGSTGHQALL